MHKKFHHMKLVSHPRSGTHWVLMTIFANFRTRYCNYWEIFGGHKTDERIHTKHPKTAIIHLYRDIEKVLISVYKMRERNGINMDSFSKFIKTPYNRMPHYNPGEKCDIIYNGQKSFLNYTGISHDIMESISNEKYIVRQQKTSWIQHQSMTPPELWFYIVKFWLKHADLNISYEDMSADQNSVLDNIENLIKWRRKKNIYWRFPIGWKPIGNEAIKLSNDDKVLLDKFRKKIILLKERDKK